MGRLTTAALASLPLRALRLADRHEQRGSAAHHGLRVHHAQQHPSFNKEIKQLLPVILQFVVARVCLHGGGDGPPSASL